MANPLERQHGTVKWFNSKKGFGFIRLNGNGGGDTDDSKDVFLHVNNLPSGVDWLRDGTPLTFVIEQTRKGSRATDVKLEG